MSLRRINQRNPSIQIKNIKPKLINLIEPKSILLEKDEALKPLELDDEFNNHFILKEEYIEENLDNIKEQKTTLIEKTNIIIISDRYNDDMILEKNLYLLEKHIDRLINTEIKKGKKLNNF